MDLSLKCFDTLFLPLDIIFSFHEEVLSKLSNSYTKNCRNMANRYILENMLSLIELTYLDKEFNNLEKIFLAIKNL